MSNTNSPSPPPLPPQLLPERAGPGSPQDVPPLPGSFPVDPATLPEAIRDELLAPDPVAIDTAAAELKDGLNHCPKCGATDIRHKPGSDLLVCLYCRNEWDGARVEEEFGFGVGIRELKGTVIASGARDIDADVASLMSFKCTGCGAEVTVNTDNAMTARCHWCRHTLGVNEQVANGAVPDAVLPFHIRQEDAVARIRQFVDKRRLFALKAFKEQFTPENVVGVYLPYMIVDSNVSAAVAGKGEIQIRQHAIGVNFLDVYYRTGAYPAPNRGVYEFTQQAADMGRFRAPSLRNAELTAPYMHDGSIGTLEAVLDFYAAGGRDVGNGLYAGDGRRNPYKDPRISQIQLNDQDKADLVAFLKTLTDHDFVNNPAFAAPTKQP